MSTANDNERPELIATVNDSSVNIDAAIKDLVLSGINQQELTPIQHAFQSFQTQGNEYLARSRAKSPESKSL